MHSATEEIKKVLSQYDKPKLHLGCFHKKIHGYINVDIRDDVNPELVLDIFDLQGIPANSIHTIYSSHTLEHLSREKAQVALNRWYEVLKPGGVARISVPDIEACCEHYMCHKDLDMLKCMFYGSQKHPYDFHYMGWDFKTLSRDLAIAGFRDIKRYEWRETEHFYIDDYSQAYLPHFDRLNGKLMSLNIEGTK